MKKIILLCLLAVLTASLPGQSPSPEQSAQVDALIKQLQAQQTQLAENQAKIDARLAELAETIRVARIYASRGGR